MMRHRYGSYRIDTVSVASYCTSTHKARLRCGSGFPLRVMEGRHATMLVATCVVVGCSVWWWRKRASARTRGWLSCHKQQTSNGDCNQGGQDAGKPDEQLENAPPKALSPAINGFLVASVTPEDGFGGFIPEDTDKDGPESSDDEDPVGVKSREMSFTSFRGKREVREASFRQRTADKVDRAKSLKAKYAPVSVTLTTILRVAPYPYAPKLSLHCSSARTRRPHVGCMAVGVCHWLLAHTSFLQDSPCRAASSCRCLWSLLAPGRAIWPPSFARQHSTTARWT